MARESHETIQKWCIREHANGNTHMLLVCDTYDYEQYSKGVTAADFWEHYRHYDGKNMQRIEGVYALTATGGTPIGPDRYPEDPNVEVTVQIPKEAAAKGGLLVFSINPDTNKLTFIGNSQQRCWQ